MKKNTSFLSLMLFLLFSVSCLAQSKEEISKIVKKTNVKLLNQLAVIHAGFNKEKREKAFRLAKEKGLVIRSEKGGRLMALQCFDRNGFPKYLFTNNAEASASTSTHHLYCGGGLGLELDGTNMKVGLWDGGNVRATHQEFNNTGIPRVTNLNSGSELSHSTHVAGTIAAGGVISEAKGMAFNANIDAYEWTDDISEMSIAAANGLLLSNHSYGFISGWYWDGATWYWYGNPSISAVEDYNYGFYDSYSADFDNLAVNAPYYLMVKSSGNDAFGGPTTQPLTHKVWNGSSWVNSSVVRDINGGASGYDCISGWGNAKNVLTVGAVDDIAGGYTQPSDVVIADFSSRGPADDGRIKPDIVGDGVNVYSTDIYNNLNTYYSVKSGTSMATPNVTGSLVLLQEYYNKMHSAYMKAATLKALVIHTADECGSSEGPDYIFGWGLLSTDSAAEVISKKDISSMIKEESLIDGTSYNLDVVATGTTPLIVTVVWTDPAGTPVADQLDPVSKMLVNDLDVKVVKSGSTYYPYLLDRQNPSAPATKGDNSTDNVEKVYISVPEAGTYSIVVDHKGTLSGGQQDFSIIVTGLSLGFPEVKTNSVNNITKKSADISGEVVSDNGYAVTERGFVYGTTCNPTINNNKVTSGSGTGVFSAVLSGLEHSTVYHARAYAVNTTGVEYGVEFDFTTLCEVVTQFPYTEDFKEGTFCPTCWSIKDSLQNGQVWQIGTYLPLGANPAFVSTDNYAYISSKRYGTGNVQNTDIISPTFDFTGYTSVSLSFKHYFKSYSYSSATLFYSIDNGSTWTQSQKWTTTTSNPATVTKSLTACANKAQVKFKWTFIYTGTSFAYYWFVDDINVMAVPSSSLTVSNTTQSINSNMAYKDVNIDNNGNLTLETDKILTITGKLTINSDAGGTGSFINKGVLNVADDSVYVQKYLPNTTTFGWNISAPVDTTLESVFDGAEGVYYYNSSVPGWQQHTTGVLDLLKGYVVRFPNTVTLLFNGALNNGTYLKNDLIRTTSPNNFGWNFIGNPFPSPIDWDASQGITRTHLNGAVYYRKWNGDVATYVGGVGVNGATNIIPSMQAFWVQVEQGQTSGAIEITNDARVHGANDTYKTMPDDILKLKVENSDMSDETVIRFSDNATPYFDSQSDAFKMFSENSDFVQLYSVFNNIEYAVNTLTSPITDISVPIGFQTQHEGKFIITASHCKSFGDMVNITLEDLYNDTLIDLKQFHTYTFNSIATASSDRFVVHFNTINTGTPFNNFASSEPVIYTYDNAIYVYNESDKSALVSVLNVLGQVVCSQKLFQNSLNKIHTNLSSGQYIVNVKGNSFSKTQRVFIK